MPYAGLAIGRKTDYHGGTGAPRTGGKFRWTGNVRFVDEHLADPLRWKKSCRIFVNSMSDLFHEKLTNEQIAAVFGVMAAAPQHTFQVLTKRAERMHDWFKWVEKRGRDIAAVDPDASWWSTLVCGREAAHLLSEDFGIDGLPWPLPNVWMGVSVENQQYADERIPFLLETPAAIRFVSYEPALGPVDFSEYLDPCGAPCGASNETLDWVICGCESGSGARPMQYDWARAVRDQCAEFGTAFFLKQMEVNGKVQKDPPPELDGDQYLEFPRR
jgi:protein gp37